MPLLGDFTDRPASDPPSVESERVGLRRGASVVQLLACLVVVTAVLGGAAVFVLGGPTRSLARAVADDPPQQTPVTSEIATDLFVTAGSCSTPQIVLTHGRSGDVFLFDSVKWYRAVAWQDRDAAEASDVVNDCLGIQPTLDEQVWASASWNETGQETWGRGTAMLGDDAFGPTPRDVVQRSELVQPQRGLFRIVYASRSSDRSHYDVHAYMFNWD